MNNRYTTNLLVEPAEMAGALSFMVADYPADERMFYAETLAKMLSAPASTKELAAVEARREDERVGAALGQLLPGRAGLVWPLRAIDDVTASLLLTHVLEELTRRDVVLVQALLDTDHAAQAAPFLAAGFHDAGTIVYMAAEPEMFSATPAEQDLAFEIVDPGDAELAEVIAASYVGSLDCLMIDGWREMADVVEGYRLTGVHRPELWRLVRWQGRGVGCLLLADYPEQERGELVYLGLRPEYRGRGWGRIITRWALAEARAQGWKHIVLAVDAANRPARDIYRATGFQDFLERRVLVKRAAESSGA